MKFLTISNLISFITYSWHVWTNSESTNLRIFPTIFFLFSLKQSRIFSIKRCLKNVPITIYFHKKRHFAATSTEKNRGFVDSEFVKTCHEQVIRIQCDAFCSHQTNWQTYKNKNYNSLQIMQLVYLPTWIDLEQNQQNSSTFSF